MKTAVIREMKTDEIEDKISEEVKLYEKLKGNHSVSPLENPSVLKVKRKYIARLKTELHARK